MSKQNFKVAIRNAVGTDNSTLELFFLDDIYNTYDWWCDSVTNLVNEVVQQVKYYNPTTVKLTIDSQGGDASIGLAIYNFLKNYGVSVETDIIGMAGSIASVIAMAADKGKLRMARNAFMVIHKAWGGAAGNSDDLRNAADVVDAYTLQIVDIYSQRTSKSVDEISALIEKGDYWMTGTEAVALGFADETYNDNEQFQIAARVKNLVPDYQNTPQLLKDEAAKNDADLNQSTKQLKTEFMNFKAKVTAFIDSITGNKIEATTPETISVDVANLIGEPMKGLIDGLEQEVINELTPIKERLDNIEKEDGLAKTITEAVTNSVSTKFETRIKALEDANALLKTENETLTEELAGLKGGKTKSDTTEPQAKVIGGFSKK